MTRLYAAACLIVVALSAPFWEVSAQEQPDSCVACHQNFGDDRLGKPVKEFASDIHSTRGFGCVACHGGDANDPGMGAMDRAKGYIGKPARKELAQLCGRCHSDARFMRQYNPSLRVDQVAEYYTSVHGQRLSRNGDEKVAVCVSCHPAHSIRPPSDPRSSIHPLKVAETCGRCHADAKTMEPYKIATDQLGKYRESIHWRTMSVKGDLSAPTCNDCHGNHGAAPPGMSWVGNVCGQCHTVMAEFFAQSRHAKVFAQMGVPGCATCHSNHDIKETGDAMVSLEQPGVCVGCHTNQDNGGKVELQMRAVLDSLSGEYNKAHAILLQAERAGMEVSQAQFELNGAKDALVKGRAAVHTFSVEAISKETLPGLEIAKKAYGRGVRALDELEFRRKGLAVSLIIILALIVGVVLKIRQMERKKKAE